MKIDLNFFKISIESSISEALVFIDRNKHGAIFAYDKEEKIVGIATDGDIRRYLIKNKDLNQSIGACINKSFLWAAASSSREYVLKLLDEKVSVIALLDDDRRLVQIVSRKNFPLECEKEITVRSRSPARISFGGGGTDLTHYFVNNDHGVVMNATIKKYSHCTLKKRKDRKICIYSSDLGESVETENLDELKKVQSFSLISSLLYLINPHYGFELYIDSDFSIGSGLGGSAVVLSAIIGCFNQFREDPLDRHQIAELAFQAERISLGISGGWQDQYATVFGGFNFIEFTKNENTIHPLRIKESSLLELEENLILCNTKILHHSGDIHKSLEKNFNDGPNIQQLVHENKNLTYQMKSSLLKERFENFGRLLHLTWKIKRQLSKEVTNNHLNVIYDLAINNGALGGKLLGAGGGGYFLFFVPPEKKPHLMAKLTEIGTSVEKLHFDHQGLQSWKRRM